MFDCQQSFESFKAIVLSVTLECQVNGGGSDTWVNDTWVRYF